MNNQGARHNAEVYIPLLFEELNAQMKKISTVRLPILLHAHNKQQALHIARALHEQGPYNTTPYRELDLETLSLHDQKVQMTTLFSSRTTLTVHISNVELLDPLQQEYLCSLIEQYGTANVRIIASSSVSLFKRMHEGRFNRNLFYYLNVIPFELPSLSVN